MEYEWVERGRFNKLYPRMLFHKMEENTIRSKLSFSSLTSQPNPHTTNTSTNADHITNLVNTTVQVLSTDGEKLMVFLKEGLQWPWKGDDLWLIKETMAAAVNTLADDFPAPEPKLSDTRHKAFLKQKAKHDSCGVYHFALWTATGHGHVKDAKTPFNAILSKDADGQQSQVKKLAVKNFFRSFTPIIQTMGILFQGVDEPAYNAYRRNYEELQKTTQLEWLKTSERCCWLGLAVLSNLQVEPHKDRSDAKDGWVGMCCAGKFTGGLLVLPELELKLQFEPGDVVYFRSAILEHYVTGFEGERSSFVFFTPATLANVIGENGGY